jgi:hypothetical protein
MERVSTDPRWKIDGYDEWLAGERVPVTRALAVDPFEVETGNWPRYGVPSAVVQLLGRGDFCDLHILAIPGAGETEPQSHLFEAVVYVLDGSGSTLVEDRRGGRRSFEWATGSLFAIPLNLRYRHLNASGSRTARLAQVTNLPMVMKLFRDEEFVFNTPHDFPDRYGDERYFQGEGTFIPIREHRHIWETNLVPDLRSFDQLRDSPMRGTGSTNIHFMLADGTMHAHASEIPSGGYKKAHRHSAGFHIFQLSGAGYSLYWYDGDEPTRVDWRYGLIHAPDDGMWHQHFNVSDVPARYMAANIGSIRYPYTKQKMGEWDAPGTPGQNQIEYEDEDPGIRALFNKEVEEFRVRGDKSQ